MDVSSLTLTPCCYISLAYIMMGFDVNAIMVPIAFVYHTISYHEVSFTSPWLFPHQRFNFDVFYALESLCVGSSTLCFMRLRYLLLISGVAHSTGSKLTTNTTRHDNRQSGVAFSSHDFGLALMFHERSMECKLCLGVVYNHMLTSLLPT